MWSINGDIFTSIGWPWKYAIEIRWCSSFTTARCTAILKRPFYGTCIKSPTFMTSERDPGLWRPLMLIWFTHASDVRYIGLYTSVHNSRKIDCDERSSGYVSKNRVSHHRYKLMYSLYVKGYNLYHRYFLGWNCNIAWLAWWLSWR